MSKQTDIDYLVAKGLPEVYAVMAVSNKNWNLVENYYLPAVINDSFIWHLTKEGFDFWNAIHGNTCEIRKGETK